jgi:ferredoxin
MKIRVKPDLCCGAGLCAMTAPGVFHLDEHGYNRMDGQTVPPGREDEARVGASACPESAIQLLDANS